MHEHIENDVVYELTLRIMIYIYTYVCVCVFVCLQVDVSNVLELLRRFLPCLRGCDRNVWKRPPRSTDVQ